MKERVALKQSKEVIVPMSQAKGGAYRSDTALKGGKSMVKLESDIDLKDFASFVERALHIRIVLVEGSSGD